MRRWVYDKYSCWGRITSPHYSTHFNHFFLHPSSIILIIKHLIFALVFVPSDCCLKLNYKSLDEVQTSWFSFICSGVWHDLIVLFTAPCFNITWLKLDYFLNNILWFWFVVVVGCTCCGHFMVLLNATATSQLHQDKTLSFTERVENRWQENKIYINFLF